ncbi:MAG: ACT domain-containing protein [Chloroflexi bacterium]|nr:ACT domain-containing protein [Chloroflexota bacterium]
MADTVRRIAYFYTLVPDRPGAGAKVLNALKAARVNLLAYTGFPSEGRRAQLVFVPASQHPFRTAARKAGIKLVGPKTAFLVQGQDRVGVIADVASKLAEARINITALDAVAAGRRRYGAVLWVKPRNVGRAAQVLGAS